MIKLGNVSFFMTHDLASKVALYLHFRKNNSPLDFLELIRAEKNEIKINNSNDPINSGRLCKLISE